ncbi:MAG: DUF2155 domain-containing protein [Proteobacteria bacterium]|nr:DUF2155 domain-containing protein [Pseudomonadota bacterium]
MRAFLTFLVAVLLAQPLYAQGQVEVIDVAPPPEIEVNALPNEPVQDEAVPEEPKKTVTQEEEILPPEEEEPPVNTVVLQGLNKVTGRISRLEGPTGTVLSFDNLEIIPRRCWKAPPEDRPENAVLLEIREMRKDEEPRQVFIGWMFSSSPGLSGMEHPVYDVNVVDCEYRSDPQAPAEKPVEPEKPAKAKEKPVKKPAPEDDKKSKKQP